MAAEAGARVIGVNNRNLHDFSVDLENCIRLRDYAPCGALFVAESGIKDREDVLRLQEAGIDGILIGETLMRAPDRRNKLLELRGLL